MLDTDKEAENLNLSWGKLEVVKWAARVYQATVQNGLVDTTLIVQLLIHNLCTKYDYKTT